MYCFFFFGGFSCIKSVVSQANKPTQCSCHTWRFRWDMDCWHLFIIRRSSWTTSVDVLLFICVSFFPLSNSIHNGWVGNLAAGVCVFSCPRPVTEEQNILCLGKYFILWTAVTSTIEGLTCFSQTSSFLKDQECRVKGFRVNIFTHTVYYCCSYDL